MATNTTHATSQASVSESNRSRIVKHLYHNGISSRAQIAKALELTPAAITKITARLIEAGMIEETGDLEGSKNRRSIGLKLNTTRFRVIGIKFARSLVQIGVFGLCGNALSIENLPTVYDNTIDDTIATIHQRVEQLLDNDPSIVAIGMAVPGPYLRNVGRTAVVSSMQAGAESTSSTNSSPLSACLCSSNRTPAPEPSHIISSTRRCTPTGNLAYYLVGEGVGLGVIDNGRLINGFLGAATEIGHISIDVNGRPCDCGNIGCLERYCSTPAIHDTLIADGTVVPGAADMTHTEAARACSPKPATATKRQSPLSAKSPDTSATDASPSSMDTIPSTSSSATSCPKPARYCSMRCAPRWPNGPSPKSMPPLPSAIHLVRRRGGLRCRSSGSDPIPRTPLGVLRRLLNQAPTSQDFHTKHPIKETKERKPTMTTPIVLSLGELLWDMLPSGKRAGGAPVNFAYHAMKNGTEAGPSARSARMNSATN